MAKKSPAVVFFGSGPVAAASLRLLARDFAVEAVVTKPRPPHHHGETPVLAAAEELALTTYTAADKIELDALFERKLFSSKVGILIDFGIIVSQKIIDYFPFGIVNSHFSVLPEWRGADPISFAILSGQNSTGVSLMLLVEAMDEGPIITYGEQPLTNKPTSTELTQLLISLSHNLLLNTLPRYLNEPVSSPQTITGRKVSYSRKLTKADGIIDWGKPATQLEREIRAYIEWPRSLAMVGKMKFIIKKVAIISESGAPGSYVATKDTLIVYCGQDALEIKSVQPLGKKEMPIRAFLAGYSKLLAS